MGFPQSCQLINSMGARLVGVILLLKIIRQSIAPRNLFDCAAWSFLTGSQLRRYFPRSRGFPCSRPSGGASSGSTASHNLVARTVRSLFVGAGKLKITNAIQRAPPFGARPARYAQRVKANILHLLTH